MRFKVESPDQDKNFIRLKTGHTYRTGWDIEYSRTGAKIIITSDLVLNPSGVFNLFGIPEFTRDFTWDEVESRGEESLQLSTLEDLYKSCGEKVDESAFQEKRDILECWHRYQIEKAEPSDHTDYPDPD